MPYVAKVFDSLRNKIQGFQNFKNLWFFQVFVLSYKANSKRLKRQKIQKTSFQWQINDWGAVFMGLNWSFSWKISKMFHLYIQKILQQETMNVTQSNSLEKVCFLWVYMEFKFLESLICLIQVNCLTAQETKLKVLKNSKIFSVFGFLF